MDVPTPPRTPASLAKLVGLVAVVSIGALFAPMVAFVCLLPFAAGILEILREAREEQEPRRTKVRVSASQDGIVVGDDLVPISDIGDAFIDARDSRKMVGLIVERRRRPVLHLRLRRKARAQQVLDALPRQRNPIVRVASLAAGRPWHFRATAGVLLALLALAAFAARVPTALAVAGLGVLVVALAAALFSTLAPAEIQAEDTHLRIRWLSRERRIHWREIAAVRAVDEGWAQVRVDLRSGDCLVLPVGQDACSRARAAHIATRLTGLLSASRSADATARVQRPLPDTTPLRRRDRSIEAWLASLRSIGSGGAGLRTAAMPRERLMRIVVEPAAGTEDRAAAAVALAHGATDPERDQLRVVALDVEPRLRTVLEHALHEAHDEELAAALDAATKRA